MPKNGIKEGRKKKKGYKVKEPNLYRNALCGHRDPHNHAPVDDHSPAGKIEHKVLQTDVVVCEAERVRHLCSTAGTREGTEQRSVNGEGAR